MELLLVRHAIAAPGKRDDARPLTAEGREKFRREVDGLGRLGLRVDLLAHSPKLRAVETADLLVPLLSSKGSTEVLSVLADPPGEPLLAWLAGAGECVALVGHQPWLGQLLAWLCTGEQKADASFELKKGGVALLTGTPSPGGMRLAWLLTPRMARAFGKGLKRRNRGNPREGQEASKGKVEKEERQGTPPRRRAATQPTKLERRQ
jgi:phosphohistidine phosphatase